MTPMIRDVVLIAALLPQTVPLAHAQPPSRRVALGDPEIDAIAQLLKLEDTRQFDDVALKRFLASPHPEVRRRAVVSVGRIANVRGRALLEAVRAEKDPEILATVAFATGQLKDPAAIPWLGGLLAAPSSPPAAAFEAARALGKIRVPDARTALTAYLQGAPATAAAAPVVGEALLSIGRFAPPGDIAPIVKWIDSPNVELRWRATWALFRPRDPAAVPHLLRLAGDRSPEVRFWAVRGLLPGPVEAAGLDRTTAAARLRDAVKDADRRVRTEALRALAQYDDDASFAVLLAALDSPDTWLSVSAAENLGRFVARKDVVVPKLVAASTPSRPTALRIAVLAPLAALSPEAATTLAQSLSDHTSAVAKTTAAQTLARLGAARQGPAPTRPPRPAPVARGDADYREIVKRWIVRDYERRPKPRVVLDTARGAMEIELHAGDAPLGLEHLVRVVESGQIVGTEFGRVVPNFVAQQRAILDDVVLRDEVNRHGLLRGTLSWASAGLDTGRPGYTLGNVPQPHNEGDFTSLGRVVRGMDVVDRIELGDKITGARIRR